MGGGPRYLRSQRSARRRRACSRWRRARTGRRGAHTRVGGEFDRGHRNDRGRPEHRGPESRGAVDDGKPRDPARRSGRPLAGVRARAHRRSGHRVAALPVAVQPPHRGGRGATAHPGERGDGRRVRRRRLRDRGDQSRPRVRGRLADEQSVGDLRRFGQGESDRPAGLPWSHGRCSARGRRVPEAALGAARLRIGAVPRPRAHGRAHDHLQHLRQPGRVDPQWVHRRTSGRHAGAHASPRRRAALRRRAGGRA